MSIKKLRAGRVPGVTAAEYVGVHGTIFWNENTGELRLSNGETPGGLRVGFPIASSTELGGVKLGPGVILNGSGQIIIDSEGLDFSFGDLASTTGTYPADYQEEERQGDHYAVLSSIDANEDIVFASNGTGAVRVVGDFSVRRADGNLIDALEEEPIFRVRADGQVRMLVPSADESEGAFTIVGGLDGVFQAPVNTGVMLHITGIASSPDPTPSRIYNDSQNSFGAFVTRRYNGTAAAPTAVLDGEEILRFSGTAHNGTLIPGVANQRIVYKALGNQTPSNQGGIIEFLATPLNSTTLSKVATLSSTGIALESGKVLTGNVTGNVSGTAGSVAAANITGTTLASNVVTSSLTTVGTLTNLSVTNTITGSVSGNAGTVTNGVYTNGSYANPSFITSLAASKVGLGSVENTALSTSTHYIGTTSITYNRASASQTLTGVSIDGNAGTVTNGVVTTGSYSDPSWLTISKSKVGLSAVENTALSTWAGSSNITTVGTLGSLTVTNNSSAKHHTSTAVELGSTAVNFNLDLSAGELQRVTVTADVTITVQNPAAGRTTRLIIVHSGNRTVTHGIAAGFTSTKSATVTGNNQIHILEFYQFGATLATDVYLGVM
jgi:hypothetical protein